MAPAALVDEMTSINAIYGDDTLLDAGDHVILRVPSSQLALRLSFPSDYPDATPTILGPESSGLVLRKGEAHRRVQRASDILNEGFRPGEPCIYDLLESLMEELERENEQLGQDEVPSSEEEGGAEDDSHDWAESFDAPRWVLSDVVTEKKSVFVARAVEVDDPKTARQNVRHLITTDKKAAKATHNMTAWRIRSKDPASGVVYQDCDDDGESAAGGRLLHLLELMNVWNVMVVVSRWYGGVHLGPDRFRIINSVGREAVVRMGLAEQAAQGAKGKSK